MVAATSNSTVCQSLPSPDLALSILQVLPAVRIVGVDSKGLFEFSKGLIKPAMFVVTLGQVAACHGIVRINSDGLSEFRDNTT